MRVVAHNCRGWPGGNNRLVNFIFSNKTIFRYEISLFFSIQVLFLSFFKKLFRLKNFTVSLLQGPESKHGGPWERRGKRGLQLFKYSKTLMWAKENLNLLSFDKHSQISFCLQIEFRRNVLFVIISKTSHVNNLDLRNCIHSVSKW